MGEYCVFCAVKRWKKTTHLYLFQSSVVFFCFFFFIFFFSTLVNYAHLMCGKCHYSVCHNSFCTIYTNTNDAMAVAMVLVNIEICSFPELSYFKIAILWRMCMLLWDSLFTSCQSCSLFSRWKSLNPELAHNNRRQRQIFTGNKMLLQPYNSYVSSTIKCE